MNKLSEFPQSKYISIPEYAQALGISRIAVYQRVIKGLIPAKKIGRNYVIESSLSEVRSDDVSSQILPSNKKQAQYFSIFEAAKKLGISRIAVFQKIKKGQISATKCGRNYLVHADALSIEIKKLAVSKRKKLLKKVKNFISIPELAQQMNLSRHDVYQKVKTGKILAEKVGRNYVVSQQNVYSISAHQEIKEGFIADEYISIPQLAKELNVSRITIYKRVKQRLIEAKKIGRNFVIKRKVGIKK